jgi:hypothetical protein
VNSTERRYRQGRAGAPHRTREGGLVVSRHQARSLVVVLIASATGCGSAAESGEDEISSIEDHVQSDYYRDAASRQFSYAAWTSDVTSTGVLFTPKYSNGAPLTRNGIPVRGTCGVTFVTPHYAITAAHCVKGTDVFDPAHQALRVEQAHLEWCALPKLQAAEVVGGTFPNYTNTPVTEADYCYRTTYSQCFVTKRCSSTFGKLACNDIEADIALIRCADRPANAAAMAVAPSDDEAGPVEMTWYHEVYSFPTVQPILPPNPSWFDSAIYAIRMDRWNHYTLYDNAAIQENYHYLDRGQQLFSLRSEPWPNGTARRRLGRPSSTSSIVWTDLYGCHGSSGSGVYQKNAAGKPELLGPATNGGSWANQRLCADPTSADFGPGRRSLSYTRPEFTRVLANYAKQQEILVSQYPAIDPSR